MQLFAKKDSDFVKKVDHILTKKYFFNFNGKARIKDLHNTINSYYKKVTDDKYDGQNKVHASFIKLLIEIKSDNNFSNTFDYQHDLCIPCKKDNYNCDNYIPEYKNILLGIEKIYNKPKNIENHLQTLSAYHKINNKIDSYKYEFKNGSMKKQGDNFILLHNGIKQHIDIKRNLSNLRMLKSYEIDFNKLCKIQMQFNDDNTYLTETIKKNNQFKNHIKEINELIQKLIGENTPNKNIDVNKQLKTNSTRLEKIYLETEKLIKDFDSITESSKILMDFFKENIKLKNDDFIILDIDNINEKKASNILRFISHIDQDKPLMLIEDFKNKLLKLANE